MFRRSGALVISAALTLSAAAGTAAFAQSKPAPAAAPQAKPAPAPQAKPAALPTGETLLAKYVEAAGGQANFDKIKNRVVQGTMDLGAAGITLSMGIYAAKPDRIYTVADSDATGRIESGVVDGVAWENSAMRGAVVKDGAEKADAMRDATLDRIVYWKTNYKSMECVGTADVDGKPAYKVVMTPTIGSPSTLYFDRDSGLVVQAETTVTSGGQSLQITSKPSDYKDVDGVKLPFTVRQYVMGQERVIKFDKIQHNVDLPADRFALPPAIKAIVDKDKKN